MGPILQAHFEVRSMHLASIGRELVRTVNIPLKERNATCRIVASMGSSTHLLPIKMAT